MMGMIFRMITPCNSNPLVFVISDQSLDIFDHNDPSELTTLDRVLEDPCPHLKLADIDRFGTKSLEIRKLDHRQLLW